MPFFRGDLSTITIIYIFIYIIYYIYIYYIIYIITYTIEQCLIDISKWGYEYLLSAVLSGRTTWGKLIRQPRINYYQSTRPRP